MMIAIFIQIKWLRYFLMACVTIALSSTTQAQTQKKQLTPANTVQKIGYVDHSRLRSEFRALQASRDSARTEWHALQQRKAGQPLQKQWQQKRDTGTQQYERRIMVAINQVVVEEGLTDVRPLSKDSIKQKNTDITDKVLGKLN